MTVVIWEKLSQKPQLIEELKKLPEGSRVPNFYDSKTHCFLRIEGKGKRSKLIFLVESGLKSMPNEPMIEVYPAKKIYVYLRDDGIVLPPKSEFFPKIRHPLESGSEECKRYCKLWEDFLNDN